MVHLQDTELLILGCVSWKRLAGGHLLCLPPHGVVKNNQGKVGNSPKSTHAGMAKVEGALDLILCPCLQEWKQTKADDAFIAPKKQSSEEVFPGADSAWNIPSFLSRGTPSSVHIMILSAGSRHTSSIQSWPPSYFRSKRFPGILNSQC